MKIIKFLKIDYVVEGTVGAPEGAIFLDTLPSAKLVELCNLLISHLALGRRIKMFQNKAKGVARCASLLHQYGDEFAEEAEAEVAFEAPITGAEFNDDLPEEMQAPKAPDILKATAKAEATAGDADVQAAVKREGLAVPKGKVRDGSKQAALVDLLKRSEGASIKEIVEALNWLPHTTRGAISRDVKKRLGYTVTTSKVEGRGRVYRIEA